MGGNLAMELYSFEGSSSALADGLTYPASTSSDAHGDDVHDDGPWYDSEEEAGGPSGQDRELQKRSQEMYNSGYRDGITAGQNASVQQGFNQGFKDSVVAGYNWGVVRGVTSALAFLPDQLKAQLVETEENSNKFQCLGESVRSVSTEDALRLFHEDVLMKKESEKQGGVDGEPCGQSSDRVSLDDYSQKLRMLLEVSPAIRTQSEAKREA